MIAACAPNRYHDRSRSAITSASDSRSSATVRRDTTEQLRHASMRSEVFPPIFFRGPVVAKRADVLPQPVADFQRLGRRHARFLLTPVASLEGLDRTPIAMSESDQVLFPHERRIAS